jgi:uncharacterized SAM-binding protein YcdF (DUF218 family)
MKKTGLIIALPFVLLFSFLLFAEGLCLWYARQPQPIGTIDFLLVPAFELHDDLELANDRVYLAQLAIRRWPNAKLLVLGESSEIQAQKLISQKLKPELSSAAQLITDKTPTSIWSTKEFLKKQVSEGQSLLLVSNEFHQVRLLASLRKMGFSAYLSGRDTRFFKSSFWYFFLERVKTAAWLFGA